MMSIIEASFVGIKQEEALRLMKNQPHLQLTMGRRTRADNAPVSKKDHKDILSQVGKNWLVSKHTDFSYNVTKALNGTFQFL